MKRGQFKSTIQIAAAAATLLAWGGLPARAQQAADASPKGMFLSDSEDRQTGVQFNVLLQRDGKSRVVSSNHRFQDGDRMKFQFKLNRDSYVYVVHRAFDGDPASKRLQRYAGPLGIQVVRDERRGRRGSDERPGEGDGSYQLLFPSDKAGQDNRLKARKLHTVPTGRDAYFTMDDNPGIEKVYLVVSPEPLDIAGHFEMQEADAPRRRSGSGRDDSGRDVLSRLEAKLADYAGNASLSLSKGMGVEIDSYGIGVETGKALMVEVDLAHHRRR